MTREELYQQHLDALLTVNMDSCSEEKVDEILTRLLQCLPNNGKLYKYRSIDGTAFDYAYDGLESGYLWMARADTVNDDFEGTLNFDLEEDIQAAKAEFLSQPWKYLNNLLQQNTHVQKDWSPIDQFCMNQIMECVDKDTGEIDAKKAVELLGLKGFTRQNAKRYIQKTSLWVQNAIEDAMSVLRDTVDGLVGINKINKNNIFVYSMAITHDADNMWGYYANNNYGFCIEYDFKKARFLPHEAKSKICRCYKVRYQEQKPKFSFQKTFQYLIEGQSNQALFKQIEAEFVEQLVTKTGGWDKEIEWRILMFQLKDCKLYADIVSKIIIDERILNTVNAQKLLALAKRRNWKIDIRKLNILGTKHIYEEYVG